MVTLATIILLLLKTMENPPPPPSDIAPTPAQTQTAELAAALTTIGRLRDDVESHRIGEVVKIIIAVIGAGGFGYFVQWQRNRQDFTIAVRRQAAYEENAVIISLQAEVQRQGKLIADLERDRIDDRNEIEQVRTMLSHLNLYGLDIPSPRWDTDKDDRLVAVNAAFDNYFLTPHGKTEADVLLKRWDQIDFLPTTVSEQMKKINDAAMQNDNRQAWCMVDFGPSIGSYVVCKAVRLINNRNIGRVGFAMSAKNRAVGCIDVKEEEAS